jgi:hypothetical protein
MLSAVYSVLLLDVLSSILRWGNTSSPPSPPPTSSWNVQRKLFLLIEASKSSDHYRVELPNTVTPILRGTEVYSHSNKYVCVTQLSLTALNTLLHYGNAAKTLTDHKN